MTYARTPEDERYADEFRLRFCILLRAEREKAGLSLRQLAKRTGCTHPYIARSISGRRMPNLPLVVKILDACEVDHRRQMIWRELWKVMKAAKTDVNGDGVAFRSVRSPWPAIADFWRRQVDELMVPDPFLMKIRGVFTTEQLGFVLTTITRRRGNPSLRQLAELSGIPRATLHGWLAGETAPSAARLAQLLAVVDVTKVERSELPLCLRRIEARRASGRRREAEPDRSDAQGGVLKMR